MWTCPQFLGLKINIDHFPLSKDNLIRHNFALENPWRNFTDSSHIINFPQRIPPFFIPEVLAESYLAATWISGKRHLLSSVAVTGHGSNAAWAQVSCSTLPPFPCLSAIFLSLLPHFLHPDLFFTKSSQKNPGKETKLNIEKPYFWVSPQACLPFFPPVCSARCFVYCSWCQFCGLTIG